MNPEQKVIRSQQQQAWKNASAGWEKWDDYNMKFLKPMGGAIISELGIRESDVVLDIASGTGEPAISVAMLLHKGKITATDLSEEMLEIARRHALNKGLSNFETRVCDVCELPFEAGCFDKISCRMGFMFFPDMQMASDEMYRVLRTGGRMATAVWGNPEKNSWVTALMGIIQQNMELPPPAPDAPSMFRCAKPGFIQSLLQQSGFKNIKEQEISGSARYKDFNEFWTITNEVSPVIPVILSKANERTQKKIKDEMETFSLAHTTSKGFEMSYAAVVTSAEK